MQDTSAAVSRPAVYRSIQTSRGLAATFVLLFHLGIAIGEPNYFHYPIFDIPFAFGEAGVEFFFVLSGFIILTAHRDDLFQPRKVGSYLRKRLIRIYPTYWIIFLGVFFGALMIPSLRHTVPHDFVRVLEALSLMPLDPAVVGGMGAPVLGVAWTLQYEMCFYLFFATLILSRVLALIAAALGIYVYFQYAGETSGPFILRFLAEDYVLVFFMGMAAAVLHYSNRAQVLSPRFYLTAGIALFSIVALDVTFELRHIRNWWTILYGVACTMIVLGLVAAEDKGRAFGGGKWMQLLGGASYALYLIHFPLISVLCKFAIALGLGEMGVTGAFITFVAMFVICIAAAMIFHVVIERPLANWLRRKVREKPAKEMATV